MDDAGGTGQDAPAVSEPSVTLSRVDGILVGLVGTWQAFALLICVHLIWCRKWPPYVTKNVALVVIATVSGVLWTVATYLSRGFVSREKGDILANCALEVRNNYFPVFNKPPFLRPAHVRLMFETVMSAFHLV